MLSKLKTYILFFILLTYLYPSIKINYKSHKILEKGLDYYEISFIDTNKTNVVHIFKINPNNFEFTLLNKSNNNQSLSVSSWSDKFKLTGAINAGMFQTDNKTNVGYMKNFDHINNKRKKSNYRSVLAFNSKIDTVDDIKLFDLECEKWEKIESSYNTIIQNYRTISCNNQQDLWKKNKLETSICMLASDNYDNIYLLFCPSQISVSKLNQYIIKLDFNIKKTMYLEGGSQASISIKSEDFIFEKSGAIFDDFLPPIPNAIGFKRKR